MFKKTVFFTIIALCLFFSLGNISFEPKTINISAGETAKIKVAGVSINAFSIGGFDNNIIDANLQDDFIHIKGKKHGNTIVFVVDKKANMAGVRVSVTEASAFIPARLEVNVVGNPCKIETIKEAIESIIRQNSLVKKGVALNIFTDRIKEIQDLGPKESSILRVPVVAQGKNYANIRREVLVVVNNINLEYKQDDYILMSNNPETISKRGVLFEGKIKEKESARLIYHHMNELQGSPKRLKIIINNPKQEKVKFLISQGIGGPAIDALYAGHIATRRFLKKDLYQNGIIVELGAGSEYVLLDQAMPRSEDSVTGIFKIWLIQGQEIDVFVLAHDDFKDLTLKDLSYQNLPVLPLDGLKGHVKGAFPQAYFTKSIDYYASQGEKMVFNLGVEPVIMSEDKNFLLAGNYGVFHDLQIRLFNDSNQNKDFFISFIPSGGLARVIFWTDTKKLTETRLLDPHNNAFRQEKYRLVSVPPDSNMIVSFKTIAQSGSYYPLRIALSSI